VHITAAQVKGCIRRGRPLLLLLLLLIESSRSETTQSDFHLHVAKGHVLIFPVAKQTYRRPQGRNSGRLLQNIYIMRCIYGRSHDEGRKSEGGQVSRLNG
jgi:hypothetical protein